MHIHLHTDRIDNILAPWLFKSGLWPGPVNFSCELDSNKEIQAHPQMHNLHLTALFRIFRSANLDMLQLLYTWVHVSKTICPHVYAHVHMCVHMFTCRSTCPHVHTGVHVEFRKKNIGYLNCLPFHSIFWNIVFHWSWSLLIWLHCLTSKPHESVYLSPWCQNYRHGPLQQIFLHGCWESKLKFSCFVDWSIFSAPVIILTLKLDLQQITMT